MITFIVFMAIWSYVHFKFEQKYWCKGKDVFSKYKDPVTFDSAADVYAAKAIWMKSFVWLLIVAFGFTSLTGFAAMAWAMAWSTLGYSVLLLKSFPQRKYTYLNLAIAVAMVIEQVLN